jgi:UDPglucose 6-dehydrogenase
MKIAVIGSGYVGLVASACFAANQHQVFCVDSDADKVARLRRGKIPIYEPGLERLVRLGTDTERLSFGTDMASAVRNAKIVMIAVGTPDGDGEGAQDLSSVFKVAEQIADSLGEHHCVVVTKSTVPVGTGDLVEAIIARRNPEAAFDVVSNPEFLREGSAIYDFQNPDRIVIGAETERARALMGQLYPRKYFGDAPVMYTGRRTSELIKYAANAFLASKIAFVNQVADLCERVGADVVDVSRGMGLDPRIGREFLRPGPGYGGSCLPKDTRALVRIARNHGSPAQMFEAVVTANDARKAGLADRVAAACGGSVAGREVALFGVTFKSNTDDMRDSPALPLIAALQAQGARIRAYDPAGMANAARLVKGVNFAEDAYGCADGADVAVLVTDWMQFRNLDLARLRSVLREPLVVDLRNLYDPAEMREAGLTYVGIGREAEIVPCQAREAAE